MFFVKEVEVVDSPSVSCRRVVVVLDSATYGGRFTSLSRCSGDEVGDGGFWKKRQWGCLFSKRSAFVVEEFIQGFSFRIGMEWSR